ncbi:sensor histidine kinase [Actinomadura parmotrematis]|uniref:histidine kinase n=1 Tax=Actinomadura parmotrematis TaxID=2864039 RepID=A0ABS7FWW0_9ACTN|nr:sensor histidine kinase [Actinomadura parmotrematis]MBW8484908.1 sensor histidine kinase [Actinomadura parmotrematis]
MSPVRTDPPRHTAVRLREILVLCCAAWGAVTYLHSVWTGYPHPSPRGAGLAVIVLNALAVVLLAAGLWATRARRHDRPGPCPPWDGGSRAGAAALVAVLPAALALYALAKGGAGIVLGMIALWPLAWMLPAAWVGALGLAFMAALTGTGALFRGGGPEYGLLVAVLGILLGAVATRQRDLAEEATRRAEAEAVVLDERSRLAREIHDILAHSLSAQIVHLEGARLLLSRDGDRTQALDRVERAQRLARAGLDETRRALAALRGDAPPPEAALADLAEEFRAATGRACAVEVTGEPRELPVQASLAIVRTAQEALTNVRKHALGARVRIVLHYGPEEARLEVVDSGGTEPVLDLAGGGYGLVGMRERAELIGGALETGAAGEGFRVALRVPA